MNSATGLDKCLNFINCHLQTPKSRPQPPEPGKFRAVTISRQAGSGGHSVAEKLAQYLQAGEPMLATPWLIFDRNLVEKVLEDHKLPVRLAKFMLEDRVSEVTDTMDELFGLHPPSWIL